MAETASRADRVVLRPGTTDDIPGLRALGEAVVPPTYGPIDAAYAQRMLDEWWTPERFADSLPRVRMLVAELDGQLVGMTTLGWLSASHRDFPHVTGDREVMWKLYVHPNHQGRGIGSRLLDLAVQWLWQRGRTVITLTTGPGTRAAAFYARRGWTDVGIQPNGEIRFERHRHG